MAGTTGLVHIYTGDGKGKTTAAIGQLVRAAGAGWRGLYCQFLKGRDTSELEPLRKLGVDILRTGEVLRFVWEMSDDEKKECVKSHQLCYNKMKTAVLAGEYDLVVLDEVMAAMELGFLEEEEIESLLRERPAGTEMILTGRNAPEGLIALADYVSEIRAVRHPYERGIAARRGIEY